MLCPDSTGRYRVGEVTGDYRYEPGHILFHRRAVTWLPTLIDHATMSESLRDSTGSIGTVSNITSHAPELEKLIGVVAPPVIVSTRRGRAPPPCAATVDPSPF